MDNSEISFWRES